MARRSMYFRDMATSLFESWSAERWKAAARGQDDVRGAVRWDGLRVPQVVTDVERAASVPFGSRPQGGWEIQQSFSDKEALMQGFMHGVEGIRTTAEGLDGEAMRALLDGVHPKMVALHVDGFETVGALRAVVAWSSPPLITAWSRSKITWAAICCTTLTACLTAVS